MEERGPPCTEPYNQRVKCFHHATCSDRWPLTTVPQIHAPTLFPDSSSGGGHSTDMIHGASGMICLLPSPTQSVLGPVDLASQASLKFTCFLWRWHNLHQPAIIGHCHTAWHTVEVPYIGLVFFICLNWRIIALQCCIGFFHMSAGISHRHTYVPFEFPEYSKFPLGIYFIHGSVYVSMLFCLFLLNNWISWVQTILADSRWNIRLWDRASEINLCCEVQVSLKDDVRGPAE